MNFFIFDGLGMSPPPQWMLLKISNQTQDYLIDFWSSLILGLRNDRYFRWKGSAIVMTVTERVVKAVERISFRVSSARKLGSLISSFRCCISPFRHPSFDVFFSYGISYALFGWLCLHRLSWVRKGKSQRTKELYAWVKDITYPRKWKIVT